MKLITNYNKAVIDVVDEFAKRYYKEIYNEDDYEYNFMDYKGINLGPLEICDEYYNIDDILMTIMYNIPIKTVSERHNLSLEAHIGGEPMNYNIYNYNILKNGTGKS